ncbi:hypothetical protein M9Y10_038657 [Tritrichomonas musculus]|uniref:Uncharacterized protein n=1 Tax=Tritrichomonas musculus TaxID=1915356 RepID=A0ABR2K914_9EUKA
MSKTTLILESGHVLQGNNTQKLLGYCNRLNNELGFNISTTNAQGGLLADRTYARNLLKVLNEFNFGIREGNIVNENSIERFIQRVQEDHPIERPLTHKDLAGMGDDTFSKWIRITPSFYNELSKSVDKRILRQHGDEAFPNNIINTAISILNYHNFAANDNTDHRYVRRINSESLQHFVDRVYSHREIPSVPPSSPPETSHREPQEHFGPFFRFGAAETFPELNPLNKLRRPPSTPQNNNNDNTILFQNQMTQPNINNENMERLINDLIIKYNISAQQPTSRQGLDPRAEVALYQIAAMYKDLPSRHGSAGARDKAGMEALEHIVLRLKKDIKRVAQAISPQGAQRMVEKHNEKSPNSPWTLVHADINGDNIPDVAIRNANNKYVYVNGYTTTKSDWPMRYGFYNQYPTREARKESGFKSAREYTNDLFGGHFDVENTNPYMKGNMLGWTVPESWQNYKHEGYKKPSNKRMTSYRRFEYFIFRKAFDHAIAKLIANNSIGNITQKPLSKYKMQIYSKACAMMWNYYIIHDFVVRLGLGNVDPNSKDFDKLKKKNKQLIDDLVSDLIAHTLYTKDGHNEQQRKAFSNHIANHAKFAILHAAATLQKPEIFEGHDQQPQEIDDFDYLEQDHPDNQWTQEGQGNWDDHDVWFNDDEAAAQLRA